VYDWLGEYPLGKRERKLSLTSRLPVSRQCFFGRIWRHRRRWKLDIVVVNGSNSAGVLLGNGDGTFKAVSAVTTSTSGNSAVFLGDFNGDNKLDLAVVTSSCDATPTCTRSVNVLLGNGDGTFGPPVGNQSTVGLHSQAVALADLDGDGKLDVAVVDDCIPQLARVEVSSLMFFWGMEMARS